MLKVGEKLRRMKILVHTCPKTPQKLFLSFFLGSQCVIFNHFLPLSAFKWPAIILSRSCVGFDVVRGYATYIEEWVALDSPAQVLDKMRNGQNAPHGHEVIEQYITHCLGHQSKFCDHILLFNLSFYFKETHFIRQKA